MRNEKNQSPVVEIESFHVHFLKNTKEVNNPILIIPDPDVLLR